MQPPAPNSPINLSSQSSPPTATPIAFAPERSKREFAFQYFNQVIGYLRLEIAESDNTTLDALTCPLTLVLF